MRQKGTAAGKSVRLLRIGEQVRHVLAGILQRGEVHDPVLAGHIVSVSEVKVSPDLRIATVYVKALGGEDKAVLQALQRNARFLRGEVAHAMTTKYTPELRFRIDETYAEAGKIDALLRDPKVARDLGG
jgi:ribosome-binding factor A